MLVDTSEQSEVYLNGIFKTKNYIFPVVWRFINFFLLSCPINLNIKYGTFYLHMITSAKFDLILPNSDREDYSEFKHP